jgi:carbon monoxide dehydrogenase subunit G
MASIRKEILIEAHPENVWAAVRDVGAVHQRLVPGVLVDARLDGDARVVTFASGAVARELLVDVDDEARRFAYAVVEGPLRATHHNASMQVFAEGSGRSRLVWITDVLPDDLAASISTLVEQGSAAMKQTLEKEAARG